MDVDRNPAAPGWGEVVERPLEGLKEVKQFGTRRPIRISLTQRNVGSEPRSQAMAPDRLKMAPPIRQTAPLTA